MGLVATLNFLSWDGQTMQDYVLTHNVLTIIKQFLNGIPAMLKQDFRTNLKIETNLKMQFPCIFYFFRN